MSEIFEFVKADNSKAILKVKELSTLMIAEHPYMNSKMDYITITRGKQHTMTVINKDGSTWSVDWGDHGCTLCSDSVDSLKWAARDFFQEECGILLDFCFRNDKIDDARIFYNDYFNAWQLSLSGLGKNQSIRFKDADNEEDVMVKAELYIGKHNWVYKRARTGIDMWVAEFPLSGPNKCEKCKYGRGPYEPDGWYCGRFGTYLHPNGCEECEYYE